MQDQSIQHTVDIFERLYMQVRFVIPAPVREEMEHALEHMRDSISLTLEESEDTLIVFGKRVWPYRKAFEDLVSIEESHRAETIFLAKLPVGIKKRYRTFVEQGGSLSDVHAGTQLLFFTPEERVTLRDVWIDVRQDIRQATVRLIQSTDAKHFEKRVREFACIFEDIERELSKLEHMADQEQEHPHLAAEIRSGIKGFEYGLSLLGPEADYKTIGQAAEHFTGRRVELNVWI